MQHLSLSTADVAAQDRFAYWREHVNEGLIGVTGERQDAPAAPFSATVEAHFSSAFAYFRYRSDPFPVARGPRQIARLSREDWIWLCQEHGDGGVRIMHDGHEHFIGPGDMTIMDPTAAWATETTRHYNMSMWQLPRRVLEPHLPNAVVPRVLHLSGAHGMNRIISGCLNTFAAELGSLADTEVDAVTDTACRLLAVACGAAAGEHREALRESRLYEAKRYIALHLANPALTPEHVAAALNISVRQLHLLFEPTGTSFARHVLQCRLDESRLALTGPLAYERAITDIALGWGFNSLATFYRTFRQAFGATPNEIRAAARRDEE
jgi:AraC-like DNA-binding protein